MYQISKDRAIRIAILGIILNSDIQARLLYNKIRKDARTSSFTEEELHTNLVRRLRKGISYDHIITEGLWRLDHEIKETIHDCKV